MELRTNHERMDVPRQFGDFHKTAIGRATAEDEPRLFKLHYVVGVDLIAMTVEYARHVAGLEGANTTEIDAETPHPVIDVLPEQKEKIARKDYGGSMRLGAYPCELASGSIAQESYGTDSISERHRHRYEVNPEYVDQLEKAGLVFSGRSPDGRLMEIAELPREQHPFMVGTQFHPELRARPLSPHPLFNAFIKAALERG